MPRGDTAFKIRLHASWSIDKNDSFEKESITHELDCRALTSSIAVEIYSRTHELV